MTATSGARTQRFVVCHNPEAAERDQQVRANLVAHLKQLIDGSDAWTGAAPRRAGRLATHQARAAPLPAPHPHRAAAHRPRRDQAGGAPGRQVAAAHLRPHPDPRRPRRRLQAAARGRTRLARLQRRPRAAPGVPPPRGPHPRPRPTVLAGAAAHPRHRERHRRHLAQHPPRTRPPAPGHPRHRPRPGRPTLGDHTRTEDHPAALDLPEPPRYFDFTAIPTSS